MTDSSWGDHGLLQTTLIKHPNLGGLPLRVRPEIAPLFQILIDELATKAKYWKDGKPRLVSDGGYNNRLVRGSKTVWSNHAWGNAVDLNAGENPMQSTLETSFVASEVTALANRLGMTWGGNYANRKDAMHFEVTVSRPRAMRIIADLNSAQDFDTIGLQRKLSARGYAVGAIDGLYGAMTIAAVKAFQEAYGLPVNGLADATTLKTMEDALTKDQFAELLARITKLEEKVQWGNEKGGGVNTGLGAESYGNAVRGSIVSAIADAVVAKLSTRGGV